MDNIFQKVMDLQKQGRNAVLVTVVSKSGEGPALAGNKMLVYDDGSSIGTVGGGNLEYLAQQKAAEVLHKEKNTLEEYNLSSEKDSSGTPTGMACGGKAILFFEALIQQQRVYIFGGGHIGKALHEILFKLGLIVTTVDDRQEIIDALPSGGKAVHDDFYQYMEKTDFGNAPYFLIATYQHLHDSTILNKIYERGIKSPYIGIVASRKTREELINSLKAEAGENVDLSNVYVPVGLDIGGTDNPWEIALAIAAEIQAIRYGKKAIHLRDTKYKHRKADK